MKAAKRKSKPQKRGIKLLSKVNRKNRDIQECYRCRRTVAPTKRYFKTSIGVAVNLCTRCEPGILNRSFGKVDAMSKAKSFSHFAARKLQIW